MGNDACQFSSDILNKYGNMFLNKLHNIKNKMEKLFATFTKDNVGIGSEYIRQILRLIIS